MQAPKPNIAPPKCRSLQDSAVNGVPLALSGAEVYQYFYYTAPMSRLPTSKPLAQRCFSADWSRPLARWGETLIEEKATRPGMHFESPYRFNAKELDEESGLYYYGARYYNPMVSVWLGVDPLAHEYPSLSPYVFTGNNPVMLVDPDGREIVITGDDGSKTTYTPGMTYEGNDKFTEAAVKAYNKSHESSEKAKEVINALVGSKSQYVVEKGEKSTYTPNGQIEGTFNGEMYKEKDAGGTIKWNPMGNNVPVQANKNTILNSKLSKDPMMGLLHESAHAFDHVNGVLQQNGNIVDGLDINEWQATHLENIMRGEMGKPLRTHYKINDFNNSPSGPSLLGKDKEGRIFSKFIKNRDNKMFYYK
jgi:RHS repeat-associated protein